MSDRRDMIRGAIIMGGGSMFVGMALSLVFHFAPDWVSVGVVLGAIVFCFWVLFMFHIRDISRSR